MIKPYELKNPKQVAEQMKNIGDSLGMPIDEGIFRDVVILNSIGFKTRQSCEGHPENERFGSYPWIDILFSDENESKTEARELFFRSLYLDLVDFYKNRNVPHRYKLTYSEFLGDDLNIRIFSMVNPNVFPDRNNTYKFYKKELDDFCEYLNVKYKLNY